ncbi:hypothetical protein P3L10_003505 [Capsicum annuum]
MLSEHFSLSFLVPDSFNGSPGASTRTCKFTGSSSPGGGVFPSATFGPIGQISRSSMIRSPVFVYTVVVSLALLMLDVNVHFIF